MDRIALGEKLRDLMGKYKYAAAVLLLGVLLMLLPGGREKQSPVQSDVSQDQTSDISLSQELEEILSQIEGVGKTKVLLTEGAGSETIYQTNEDGNESEESRSLRVETVIVSGTDRGEYGLVRQVNPPAYLGAIVVCQGAEQPSVRLAVVQAVSGTTGIPTDRITVLKMK